MPQGLEALAALQRIYVWFQELVWLLTPIHILTLTSKDPTPFSDFLQQAYTIMQGKAII